MDHNNHLKENQQAIQQFLESRKVLIVDPNTTASSGVYKIFQDLGVKTNHILLANTFREGSILVESEKPHILVAEYNIGVNSGFELVQKQREQWPKENRETIFIIVTSNTSQTAVAQAAEEEVDAFIIKPYNIDHVRNMIVEALIQKVRPPEYIALIQEGKILLEASKFKEAEEKFSKATTMHNSPSLAYYYLGYSKYLQNFLLESKNKYGQGLQLNQMHYKCLIGMYDLFMLEKEHEKAYEIGRKLVENFPVNTRTLSELLRLAVLTRQFQDIEEYYNIFANINERNEELDQHICAALVVSGKYFLITAEGHSKAIELFQKAIATGQAKSFFIKEIILSLLKQDLIKEAENFLAEFLPTDQKTTDFLLCQFLVKSKSGLEFSALINEGRALIAQGVINDLLYSMMIQFLAENSLWDEATSLKKNAIQHFPNDKAHFEALFKKNKN